MGLFGPYRRRNPKGLRILTPQPFPESTVDYSGGVKCPVILSLYGVGSSLSFNTTYTVRLSTYSYMCVFVYECTGVCVVSPCVSGDTPGGVHEV